MWLEQLRQRIISCIKILKCIFYIYFLFCKYARSNSEAFWLWLVMAIMARISQPDSDRMQPAHYPVPVYQFQTQLCSSIDS